MQKNKGITLIALVITIIVMLILVGVTITMAVNGGLFEYTERAGVKTNDAINKEQQLASGKANITGEMVDIYDYANDMIIFTVDLGTPTFEEKFDFKVKKGTTWDEFIQSSGEENNILTIISGNYYEYHQLYESENKVHVFTKYPEDQGVTDRGYLTLNGNDVIVTDKIIKNAIYTYR